MRLILSLISIFFFQNLSFSQTIDFVKIKNSKTNESIPNVSIYSFKYSFGGYSDEQGIFKFPIKYSPINDSIKISSIGYFSKVISLKDINQTIFLDEKKIEINEIIVVPKGEIVQLGAKSNSTRFVTSINSAKTSENEIALLIDNPNNLEGKIFSVGYYIANGGRSKTPFRVRLYSVSEFIKPLSDLLLEDVIVKGDIHGGWLDIDLEKYNINFPKNGFFISMEWLYALKKSGFYKVQNYSSGKVDIHYGQDLGLTDEFKSAISFKKRFDEDWLPFKEAFPKNISINNFYPMMRTKIKLND